MDILTIDLTVFWATLFAVFSLGIILGVSVGYWSALADEKMRNDIMHDKLNTLK